jgi:hypothetical protein
LLYRLGRVFVRKTLQSLELLSSRRVCIGGTTEYPSRHGNRGAVGLSAYRETITMTKTFRTALYLTSALAFGAASLSAHAQGNGPGGMMGGNGSNGWGMGYGYGWGMGGFGGIGVLVLVLGAIGIAALAVRRRNP